MKREMRFVKERKGRGKREMGEEGRYEEVKVRWRKWW